MAGGGGECGDGGLTCFDRLRRFERCRAEKRSAFRLFRHAEALMARVRWQGTGGEVQEAECTELFPLQLVSSVLGREKRALLFKGKT